MSVKKFNVGVKVLEMKRHLLNYCLIIFRRAREFSARGQRVTQHNALVCAGNKQNDEKQMECKWNKKKTQKACIFVLTLSHAAALLWPHVYVSEVARMQNGAGSAMHQ